MLDLRYLTSSSKLKQINLECNGYKESYSSITLSNENVCIRRSPGGSCLNTLRLISEKTKIETFFIGAIGNDKNLEEFENLISKDKTKYLLEYKNKETAVCEVFLNNNDRSLVTNLGAANSLTIEFIEKQKFYIDSAEMIYICAFFASAMPECCLFFIKNILKEQTLVFNLSYHGLLKDIDRKLLKMIFDRSNIIIGNKNEFVAFYEIFFNEILLDDKEKIRKISKGKLVMCTDGDKQVVFCENDNIKKIMVNEIGLKYLDTCGAGDYFAAGAISSLIDKKSIEEAVLCGISWAKEQIYKNSLPLNK
ncbi:hypothetical protein GVAV_000330 [Gurleya vavrai]